ncbi:hypothetical protein PSN45_003655 [Yamadazyma tenuis]|uniref:Acetylornithine aminotransferase, mitochondrial n=1 Tax=Candida tenuis (strain ATCC 10573 / BCRC 21748 / CBS 615 / JCM 9827 / NBRC 10315 / NRRL Y-1498 / VKM Y-70) TaxID=590646 RepID=G3B3R3_CANTC|nr:uncharacterized protein CANTEDRAFT_105365 [Yamadazyma tenuis ATCC 10573]EGV64216.1 hypothetical protein CANTEDRAFT_105365 [Yamadazyma tenuis ATCC 10573]WEJ96119.1 hypothetical protein PSN45_003655 [Yamadazyma tenuis]
MTIETSKHSLIAHRILSKDPNFVKNTKGKYLILPDRKVLDACGGAAVVSVGHCNPDVNEAIKNQLDTVSYVHSLEFTTEATEKLGRALVEDYKDKFGRVYVVTSGSEATNAALKLAIQYHQERGITTKTEVISRNQSYHGNCIGGLSLSGYPARKRFFENILSPHMHKVSPAYEYRYKLESESTEKYVDRLAKELEDKILELGPENVAAFFAETIVGATTGAVPAPPGYFKEIRKVCDKYDVLLVLDEIMCGSGRTGKFFAWEHEGIVPDVVTCGKSMSSGYSPLSACFFSNKIVEALENGSDSFSNGHTYQAFPLACSAGVAVLNYIKDNNLLENVTLQGEYLGRRLKEIVGDSKIVGDIRGRGLFWGLELVKNKQTKEPFEKALNVGYQLKTLAFENGIAIYPGSGTIDGYVGDHVLLAPMYISTSNDIDIIVETLAKSIGQLENELGI